MVMVVKKWLILYGEDCSLFFNALYSYHGSVAFVVKVNAVCMIATSLHLIYKCSECWSFYYTSGKNFIKITSVGMGAAKSNETR